MTREEVVEILKELWRYEKTEKYNDAQIREALGIAVEAVNLLNKQVEKKRPTGHWEEVRDIRGDPLWRCDCCGIEWVFIEGDPIDNGAYYCPNCGAKMEEE